jgi:hypothetical protein
MQTIDDDRGVIEALDDAVYCSDYASAISARRRGGAMNATSKDME